MISSSPALDGVKLGFLAFPKKAQRGKEAKERLLTVITLSVVRAPTVEGEGRKHDSPPLLKARGKDQEKMPGGCILSFIDFQEHLLHLIEGLRSRLKMIKQLSSFIF